MIGLRRKIGSSQAMLLAVGMGIGIGCQPSNNVVAGAPQLLKFSVIGTDGQPVGIEGAGAVAAVSPRATFDALFDRLLDPAAIERLDADGGRTGQPGVATIASDPAVDPASIAVAYTPNGAPPADRGPQVPDGGGPALIPTNPPGPHVDITPTKAMPCATMVSVALTPSRLRSHDGQLPFKLADDTVESTLAFLTEPLTATITVPMVAVDAGTGDPDGGMTLTSMGVPASSVAHVTFNTLVPADQIQLTVKVQNVVLPDVGSVARDGTDPTTWNVTPPRTGWPPGAEVTVAVIADAMDGYGVKIGAVPDAQSFTVAVAP